MMSSEWVDECRYTGCFELRVSLRVSSIRHVRSSLDIPEHDVRFRRDKLSSTDHEMIPLGDGQSSHRQRLTDESYMSAAV